MGRAASAAGHPSELGFDGGGCEVGRGGLDPRRVDFDLGGGPKGDAGDDNVCGLRAVFGRSSAQQMDTARPSGKRVVAVFNRLLGGRERGTTWQPCWPLQAGNSGDYARSTGNFQTPPLAWSQMCAQAFRVARLLVHRVGGFWHDVRREGLLRIVGLSDPLNATGGCRLKGRRRSRCAWACCAQVGWRR